MKLEEAARAARAAHPRTFVEATTKAGRAEKSVYYHGTSKDLLSIIRKQGLIPDPKTRVWNKDHDRGYNQFDRTSYGGIYVTRNLMTAMSSANTARLKTKKHDSSIVVIMELQPRTFFLDEDDVLFSLGNARLPGTSNSEQVIFWLYIEWKYGDGDADENVRKSKQHFEDELLHFAEKRLGGTLDQGLKDRLKQLSPRLWEAAVTRTTAYYEKAHGSYWESSWKKDIQRYSSEKKYPWDMPDFPMPPKPDEAEAQFRKTYDQLTKTLKSVARPVKNPDGYSKNGRLTTPVGYSGENRIIAIVEELPEFKYRVVYGTVPEDFRKQWKERVGSDPDEAKVAA